MILILILLILTILILLYSLVVISGQADDIEQKYWEQRAEKQKSIQESFDDINDKEDINDRN